jgi:hypothetical protein
MHLNIHSVTDKGVKGKEIIWLRASATCNAREFLLADTTFNDDQKVSNELRHLYWFPNTALNAEDWIALHSGEGLNTTRTDDKRQTIHDFYWGLGVTVWNKGGDRALLFRQADFSSKLV